MSDEAGKPNLEKVQRQGQGHSQGAGQGRSRQQGSDDPAAGLGPDDTVHGEGNYKATRDYNESTKRFIDAGKVEKAADDAAPRSAQEARDMEEAERAGKSHLKEDDPPKGAAPSAGR